MNAVNSISITIPNPTAAQLVAITELLETANATTNGTKTTKSAKKTAPAKTVSDDEEESFGTSDMDEDDVTDENEDEEEEEEEAEVEWDEVKAALNKVGSKDEAAARTVLLSFNCKTTSELKAKPKKWGPAYRKLMAQVKAWKKK